MKILLTGASSFTGYWFANTLATNGHQVIAPLRSALGSYNEDIRAQRVRKLKSIVEVVENCSFGSPRFIDLVRGQQFDVLCHHAAQVGDYRNPDFDIAGALALNTLNLRQIVRLLKDQGAKGLVLTGSVFEQNEGAGDMPLRAFSPYGLSKGFTAQVTESYCHEVRLPFGKFIIPNPFGPYEEPRFTAYLMRTWKAGQIAKVNTPIYVRDNIHVDLLAMAYGVYVKQLEQGNAVPKACPSGYVESQGVFAKRYAAEMRVRLMMACEVEFRQQTDFSEPLVRINTAPATLMVPEWSEGNAWESVSNAYQET